MNEDHNQEKARRPGRQFLMIALFLVGLSALAISLGPRSSAYGIIAAMVGVGLIGLVVEAIRLGLRAFFRPRD